MVNSMVNFHGKFIGNSTHPNMFLQSLLLYELCWSYLCIYNYIYIYIHIIYSGAIYCCYIWSYNIWLLNVYRTTGYIQYILYIGSSYMGEKNDGVPPRDHHTLHIERWRRFVNFQGAGLDQKEPHSPSMPILSTMEFQKRDPRLCPGRGQHW